MWLKEAMHATIAEDQNNDSNQKSLGGGKMNKLFYSDVSSASSAERANACYSCPGPK